MGTIKKTPGNIVDLDGNNKKNSAFGSNGDICTKNINIVEAFLLLHVKKTCYSFTVCISSNKK